MIKISSIKQYMYCPMNLYHKTHIDSSENKNYQLARELKKLRIDVHDLIQKNIRKVKKDMTLTEIECVLSENIDPFIKSSAKSIRSLEIELENKKINEIIDNTYFNIKITALKVKKAMTLYDKDAFEIVDTFFPNCMYYYLVKDEVLNVIGMCDKIEIIDGTYYPILLKSGNPPLTGVWPQDAIELVSTAMLLEDEFTTDVYVGFVDYEKLGDRRPVVMDVELRRKYFNILREVKEILKNGKKPEVKKSFMPCDHCEYQDICVCDE